MASENGNGNGRNGVTWKIIAVSACVVLVGIIAWAWNDSRACIRENKLATEQKVDRTQYYRDIDEIKTRMERMDGKLDRLMQRGR